MIYKNPFFKETLELGRSGKSRLYNLICLVDYENSRLSLIPQQWFFNSLLLPIFQVREGREGGNEGEREGDDGVISCGGHWSVKSLMVESWLKSGRDGRQYHIMSLRTSQYWPPSVSELRKTTPVQPWPRRWWLSTTAPRRFYWGPNTTPTLLTSGLSDASLENFWEGEYCSR